MPSPQYHRETEDSGNSPTLTDVEHDLESETTSLITHNNHHLNPPTQAKWGRRPSYPLFKTTVLLALTYLCFLETLRIAVDDMVPKAPHHGFAGETEPPYSPANEAIQYAPKRIWQEGDSSPFNQKPSPALDALWDDLLIGQNIRITKAEMLLQNENLTHRAQVQNGDFLGLMSVWHSLHCLDVLRKGVNMEYYMDRIPQRLREHGPFTTEHYNHCIERLRSDITCRPNIAVYIPQWDPHAHHRDGMVMRSAGQTSCVNWDALDQWARKRALREGEWKLRSDPFGSVRKGGGEGAK